MASTFRTMRSNPAIKPAGTWEAGSWGAEDWRGVENPAPTDSGQDDSQPGNLVRGLVSGLVLSAILWAILIFGGREVWRLLH